MKKIIEIADRYLRPVLVGMMIAVAGVAVIWAENNLLLGLQIQNYTRSNEVIISTNVRDLDGCNLEGGDMAVAGFNDSRVLLLDKHNGHIKECSAFALNSICPISCSNVRALINNLEEYQECGVVQLEGPEKSCVLVLSQTEEKNTK